MYSFLARSVSSTPQLLGHKLRSRPTEMHKIPTLPDEALFRIRKGKVDLVPTLGGELKTRWGPKDARRWPREVGDEKDQTKKKLIEAKTAAETEHIMFKHRERLAANNIVYGISLMLKRAEEEKVLDKFLDIRHPFWDSVAQADRWIWRMSADQQARLLETLANYGVQTDRTFRVAQSTLEYRYDEGYMSPKHLSQILFAYTKSSFVSKYKGFHRYIFREAEKGPLKLHGGWESTRDITQAVWSLASVEMRCDGLYKQLESAALTLDWSAASLHQIALAANSFSKGNQTRLIELSPLMQVFRDAALPKLKEADIIQLAQLANAFRGSRGKLIQVPGELKPSFMPVSDPAFDSSFAARTAELSEDMSAVELYSCCSYLVSRNVTDAKTMSALSTATESVFDNIYSNHALVQLVKSHATAGNNRSKLYKNAIIASVPYLPCFYPEEISQFAMALCVARAPVNKLYIRIGNIVRTQLKANTAAGELYPAAPMARLLSAFALSDLDHPKFYGEAIRSLHMTLLKDTEFDAEEGHAVIHFLGGLIAGGVKDVAKENVDVLLQAFRVPSLLANDAAGSSLILYQSKLLLKAYGVGGADALNVKPSDLNAYIQKRKAHSLSSISTALTKNKIQFTKDQAGPEGYNIDFLLPNKTAILFQPVKNVDSSHNLSFALKCKHLSAAGYTVIKMGEKNAVLDSESGDLAKLLVAKK